MKTAEKVNHTPTPWKFKSGRGNFDRSEVVAEIRTGDKGEYIIADIMGDIEELQGVDNAEFICRAVNSYEAMLEALRDISRISRKASVPKRTIAERAEEAIKRAETTL